MAAVIGDYIPEPSRFHAMIANPPLQHHHHHPHPQHSERVSHDASSYRAASRPRTTSSSSTPRPNRSSSSAAAQASPPLGTDPKQPKEPSATTSDSAAARIPSPPPSSSPAAHAPDDDANHGSMASEMITTTVTPSHASAASTSNPVQQPSPASDSSLPASITPQAPPRQTTIHVRDLAHVKDLAQSDLLSNPPSDAPSQNVKYDISAMPTYDIIEMVAALLTKITSTNDLQHDAMQRNVTHQQQANQSSDSPGGSINPMTHSVLAFHGKNVPAITILSYLSRIHKYCPTTFEVFLSLLVFFDRMTERVNDLVTKSEEARKAARAEADTAMRDSTVEPDESDSDLADDDDDDMDDGPSKVITVPRRDLTSAHGPSTYFVVDSFNIHRLIIAGVTAASKFFSDVFYTNSRYAKVGGLPLAELNHLELQFLILNDFRLSIPVEDLEAYATMLVEFYAREVVSQEPQASQASQG